MPAGGAAPVTTVGFWIYLRLGVTRAAWEVAVFVNNLTNEQAQLALDRERGLRARVGYLTNQPRTFAYSFDWPAPRVGSCHGIDIPFTFGTIDRGGWDEFTGAVGERRAEAEQLSVTMMESWANFARTGDPSSAGTGPWPAYTVGERLTMVLGAKCEAVPHPAARPGGFVSRLVR